MEEDIDTKILKCIEKEFKGCKEIVKLLYPKELHVRQHMVYMRLRQLRKYGLVTFFKSRRKNGIKGVKPTLYKKKIQI